jgi:hypothetical protein
MHAVIGIVSIQAGREEEAAEDLKTNALPAIKQAPGVIAGYFVAPQDGKGMGFTLYETEDNARAAVEMARNAPLPEGVSFDSIDVREVVAQL